MRKSKSGYFSDKFIQRTRVFYTEEQGLPGRNILDTAIDRNGTVWAATDLGLAMMKKDKFVPVKLDGFEADMAFQVVFCDRNNAIWAGSGNRVFLFKNAKLQASYELASEVRAFSHGYDGVLWLICNAELYKYENNDWRMFLSGVSEGTYCAGGTSVAAYEGDLVYAGTVGSLLTLKGKRYHWRNIQSDKSGLIDDAVHALQFDKFGHLWVGTDKGVAIYDNKSYWADGRTVAGLPKMKVTCMAFDDCGGRYFGTDKGVIYYKNGKRLFFGAKIWIPDCCVHAVAVSGDGEKIAVATKDGLSIISSAYMTLREKADYYQEIAEKYHNRMGYVINCHLKESGNKESASVEISDNDGLWTGCYIVSQCYRYAATKDERALESARTSMKALIKLVDVTGMDGFTSRAIRFPGEEGYGNGNREWHLSPDGSCEWKGETSSDEMTGHFLAYSVYYDLCADEEEKKEIRRVVSSITDHIIANDYHLVDVDGKPTTWATWCPDDLNNDDKWVWEKGINSLEILAFLKDAYHITGQEKYNEAYLKLIKRHHYAMNILQYKMPDYHTCHIDDNLAALCNLNLFRLEEDEDIKAMLYMGLEHFWQYERVERNPLLNLFYGILSDNPCDVDIAVQSLREYNLDLTTYSYDTEGRDDIEIDYEPESIGEGKQLKYPIAHSERNRYNYDRPQFALSAPDDDGMEYPVVYLLPYWIAKYYGIIKESDEDLNK